MKKKIFLHNLSKDFLIGESVFHAVKDISLELFFGEMTMIVGPSGCGKTTLLSLLSGILSPSQGSVQIDSTDLTNLSDYEKTLYRRHNIGFIFQEYNLIPSLTISENVALPLIALGLSYEESLDKAEKTLGFLGIHDRSTQLPAQLSGGEKQRVAIARGLIQDPLVVVCDEPTASLDGKNGQEVMALLRNIANKPERAVIIVSHDQRIFSFADRVIEMEDGKIIKDERKAITF